MKLLQINAVYGVGSTGFIMRDIHELCLFEGIESFVAYSTTNVPESEIKNGYKIGGMFGKKLHAVLCRINGMQGYFSRFSTRRLLNYIEKIKPDIVSLHNLHSNYIHLNMLLRYLAKKDIKTIVTLHDCWYFTGGCFHYTAAGCDKWKKECGKCPKKRSDTPAFLFDRSKKILRDRKKYFDKIQKLTVIGVSEWIAEEAKKGIFKGRDVCVVHNGVDLDTFKPTESDIRQKYGVEDKFVILGPASKWLSTVNRECFEKITQNLKDDEVLMLLGCTEEQKQNLPEGVIPLPFIRDRVELAKVYSAADVLVNPTREDTLCFMNLEPQACGTPVITFANTGTRETVDGVCGFTVENDNFASILEKIDVIKRGTKSAYSSKCVEWIRENFKKKESYLNYIKIVSKISKR
ncbi:MAG: glycosyltransferase [Clostridia bacterium]|nr:glycosyltransferase [Clostridia bacterium]